MYGNDSSQRLTVTTVFTSLTIMSLIIAPLSRLLSALPSLVSSLGCFGRIQAFLERCERLGPERKSLEPRSLSDDNNPPPTENAFELSTISPTCEDAPIIRIEDASFSVSAGESRILHNISLTCGRGTLTVLTGKVSSGKSMLLLGLLGELPTTRPTAVGASGIAYCAQTPWLVKGTIRTNIIGVAGGDLDRPWYDAVIKACALDHDFSQLPVGDQFPVESKGHNLSGGQRHRIVGTKPRVTSYLVTDP